MPKPSERHRVFAHLYFLQRFWEPLGLARHRRAVARGAIAPALEIGIGSGFSLPYYQTPPMVACDPNLAMLRKARRRARRLGHSVHFVVARGEALPFASGAFATVVSEVVLCTVDSPEGVAREVRRVLASDGHYRFVEHGIASRPVVARIQRLVTPVWRRLFGGCRLDRDTVTPLIDAGLQAERLRRCSGGSVVRATFTAEAHQHERPPNAARDAGAGR